MATNISDNQRKQLVDKYYCSNIWKTVYLTTGGEVLPCCVYTDRNKVQPNLDNIHNSTELVNARKKVLSGDLNDLNGCRLCREEENNGIERSYRYNSNTKDPSIDNIEATNEFVQDHSIEKVDIRLGNVCNFACNFCNANNSHTIAKERGETVLNNWFENKNEIFANIKNYSNLKYLNVAGGEPFYNLVDFFQLLDTISTYNKSKINVKIITNVSKYDSNIVEELLKFNEVQINFSIDATNQHIEYARYKSKWKTIQTNVKKYLKLRELHPDKIRLSVVPTFSIYTIVDAVNLCKWLDNHDLTAYAELVTWPQSQQIKMFNQKALHKIYGELKPYLYGNKMHVFQNAGDLAKKIDDAILNNDLDQKHINRFWEDQTFFESKRKNYSLQSHLGEYFDCLKKPNK